MHLADRKMGDLLVWCLDVPYVRALMSLSLVQGLPPGIGSASTGTLVLHCVNLCPLVLSPVLGPVDTPLLLGSALANSKLHLHSSIKRKLAEEKGYVFDKRLRYNVRQNESNCRFRDIVVRKEEGFTHVLLSTQTTENNALTPEVKCSRRFQPSDS